MAIDSHTKDIYYDHRTTLPLNVKYIDSAFTDIALMRDESN